MSPSILQMLTGMAVITVTLSAGLFLTFSDFVMRSLGSSNPAAGIEAMQMINREIMKSVTMVLLLGNIALTLSLAGLSYLTTSNSMASPLLITAAASYAIGVMGVTMVFNVPMNNRLDKLTHTSAEAATYWQTYVPRWTFWNTARVLATLVSAICLLIAFPTLTF